MVRMATARDRPRKWHRKRNIILAAIGAFVIIGAIGSAFSGSKTSSAPAAVTSPKAAATTAPPATSAPSATTPPAETTSQQITGWAGNGDRPGWTRSWRRWGR